MRHKTKAICRHCERPCTWPCRGLCSSCYKDLLIRCQYTRLSNGKAGIGACNDDQTDAELEAVIAIQRLTMPVERERDDRPVGVYIPRVVLSGLGVKHRGCDE